MKNKKPMIKETVGAAYYAFNTPDESGEYSPSTYEATVKSPVIKSIGTNENAESSVVRASGTDYSTSSQTSSVELAIKVVAFHPDDLAKLRGDNVDTDGLISSGRPSTRPFIALGFPILKKGGGVKYTWYPKCQLIENTDDIATSEEKFSEQNDTLTLRAYAFNDDKDIKNYVDSEATNFPTGLTEEEFFTTPIITKADLDEAMNTGSL
ncbi:MAG: phage tail protein [Bacilli bacterium]|nr:phage tail protein [Bacilli bacterium]